jgi:hypothetical protein
MRAATENSCRIVGGPGGFDGQNGLHATRVYVRMEPRQTYINLWTAFMGHFHSACMETPQAAARIQELAAEMAREEVRIRKRELLEGKSRLELLSRISGLQQ